MTAHGVGVCVWLNSLIQLYYGGRGLNSIDLSQAITGEKNKTGLCRGKKDKDNN